MNKKVLVIALAVAMLILPICSVFAVKPEPTMTLEGTFEVYPDSIPGVPWSSPYVRGFPAGKSGIVQLKWKDLPEELSGDIEGLGTYTGNWVVTNGGTPDMEVSSVGIVFIEDAVVAGIGTGDLKFKAENLIYTIISATGELEGLKGRGSIEMITPTMYSYSFDVQIKP